MRLVSTHKRCALGYRHNDGGVPPKRGKVRKRKGHVARFVAKQFRQMKRCLGDVCPVLRRCAREDFQPSQRLRQRARIAEQRRDPRFAWFYARPWKERDAIRRTNEHASITWEELMAAWNYREARDARRMVRSLKRRRKVQS